MQSQIARRQISLSVSIADGDTKSGAFAPGEFAMGGLATPSTFEGTTLSFEVSADGTTFVPLYNEAGGAIAIPNVSTSRAYAIPPELFAFAQAKIVSGSAASGAARVISLSLKT